MLFDGPSGMRPVKGLSFVNGLVLKGREAALTQLVLHKYPSFSTQRGMTETSTLFFSKLGAESSFIFIHFHSDGPGLILKASGIIILPFFKSLNYEKTKQIAGK